MSPRGLLTASSHGFQIDRAVEAGAQREKTGVARRIQPAALGSAG
jgi:hypothetical protein